MTAPTYLTNAWYAVAFGNELSATPLKRVLLGQPVALFRGASGRAPAAAS